jgi:hypothetical protein
MASAVEVAVDTYVRAWCEADPALREKLIEQCFAVDGRLVTRSGEVRGREALAQFMTRTRAAPEVLNIRPPFAIDARGNTFRFRAVADLRNGTSPETLEAGEINADGQISIILTFTGPLE